ncbi:PEP-CTERM sorting domain-containing protein, partial [Pseudomonadota bacterium]
ILYNDFSDVSGLTLNGSAAALTPNADNNLRLTSTTGQSASAFSTSSISLASDVSFSTAFSFNISNPSGISDGDGQGADGLTFTLQTNSNTAGGGGGGIGYSGITNSFAVEFDTWNNGGWDDHNGNHVGINLGGNIDSVLQTGIATRMNNSQDWFSWIDYNGVTDLLEVRLAQVDLRPTTALLAYTVDLTGVLGSTNAFAGFTSGTGGAGGQHDILDWQFNSEYKPITTVGEVPSPAPLALMLAGMGALCLRRRNA